MTHNNFPKSHSQPIKETYSRTSKERIRPVACRTAIACYEKPETKKPYYSEDSNPRTFVPRMRFFNVYQSRMAEYNNF